jgi:hypothetical protein
MKMTWNLSKRPERNMRLMKMNKTHSSKMKWRKNIKREASKNTFHP